MFIISLKRQFVKCVVFSFVHIALLCYTLVTALKALILQGFFDVAKCNCNDTLYKVLSEIYLCFIFAFRKLKLRYNVTPIFICLYLLSFLSKMCVLCGLYIGKSDCFGVTLKCNIV